MRVRIYTDTSVLGGCEDDEFREPSRRWLDAFERGEPTLLLSELTVRELEGAPDAVANATMRQAIERVCREAGYEPPVICTPEELIDDWWTRWRDRGEIQRRREAHAESFDHDLKRITEDLQRQERESGAQVVQRPPRKPQVVPKRTSA